MQPQSTFTDIHSHLLPAIDDGADSMEETLTMARLAVEDGITQVIVTPHQLGNYQMNSGALVRELVQQVQQRLIAEGIRLTLLPGADVRIEEGMLDRIKTGEVLTLADRGKHILLELPHELYYPLEGVIEVLASCGIQSILSHPERNQGLLRKPEIVGQLVEAGCLMQVTAGSLVGTFGPKCRQMSELLLARGWVHFLATDAHGMKSRRPLLSRAFVRTSELVGSQTATKLCHDYPNLVVAGQPVPLKPKLNSTCTRTSNRSGRTWLQRLVSA